MKNFAAEGHRQPLFGFSLTHHKLLPIAKEESSTAATEIVIAVKHDCITVDKSHDTSLQFSLFL